VITRVRRISASGLRASDSTCEGIFIAEELWKVRGGLAVSVNQVISGSPCSPKVHQNNLSKAWFGETDLASGQETIISLLACVCSSTGE
jgi:hypothetical protein